MTKLINELKSNENLAFFSTKKLKATNMHKMRKCLKQIVQMHAIDRSIYPFFPRMTILEYLLQSKSILSYPSQLADLCGLVTDPSTTTTCSLLISHHSELLDTESFLLMGNCTG